jgi:hypothetical protein
MYRTGCQTVDCVIMMISNTELTIICRMEGLSKVRQVGWKQDCSTTQWSSSEVRRRSSSSCFLLRIRIYDPIFSSRFANRTLGWLILHLKKAKDVGDNTQAPIASMETVREHNLRMAFTLEHWWLRTMTTRRCLATIRTCGRSWRRYPTTTATWSTYSRWRGQRTGKNHAPMKLSVRGFASAKMIRQTGDPMRAVKVSTLGPERGPTVLEPKASRRQRGSGQHIRSAARRSRG